MLLLTHVFSRSKSLLANLKMDPALVSRFDLVFVLLDCPNAELDKLLSDQVLSSFNKARTVRKAVDYTDTLPAATQFNRPQSENLYHRLTTFKEPKPNPLSHHQLRQVIGYAKANVSPKMTSEAAELLKAFYLELRQTHRSQHDDNLLPITTRHLESLIRLSEARAKMEFRTAVLASDAQDVIDLVRYCMYDFLSTGPNTASSMSAEAGKRNKGSGRTALLKRFISELIQISANTGEAVFTEVQLKELHTTLQMTAVYPFTELIESLNQHGYIIKRSSGSYKLCV
jgi:DNA helicase MCM8